MREKKFCHYCGSHLKKKLVEGRMRLHCEACATTIYENPTPASCVVVIDDKDRILLVKRSVDPKKGLWCLPGGFMELGETAQENALRELYEETGIKGRIELLLGVDSDPNKQYHTVALTCFLVREFSGSPKPGDDAQEVCFFSADKLPEIAFNSHARFIRAYLAAYSGKGAGEVFLPFGENIDEN